jgi:hypothetical protein
MNTSSWCIILIIHKGDPSQIRTATVIPKLNQLLKKNEFRNGLKLSVMNNTGIAAAHKEMTQLLHKLDQ